jgi:hypothetical protein
MTNWNKLLLALDATVGFPNKVNSTVKKVSQGFDQKTGEYVITLQYRVRVNPGQTQPQPPKRSLLATLIGRG